MAAQAELKISGLKAITVLSLSFGLSKTTNEIGKPQSIVRGGEVSISCEIEDNELFAWLMKGDAKGGEVTFSKVEAKEKLIELKWTNGYITSYSVGYGDGSPISCSFTVSAEKLEWGGTTHDNKWSGSK